MSVRDSASIGETMPFERRAFKRHAVVFDEIQAFVLPGQDVCRIRNISMGGVGIEYAPVPGKPFQIESIHILTQNGRNCYLQNIRCQTVYDMATLMEGRSFRGGERRIRGLKFINQTPGQKEELDHLLGSAFGLSDE